MMTERRKELGRIAAAIVCGNHAMGYGTTEPSVIVSRAVKIQNELDAREKERVDADEASAIESWKR